MTQELAPHYDGTFFELLAHGARPSAAAVMITKFTRHGFRAFDVIRPAIWTDPAIECW